MIMGNSIDFVMNSNFPDREFEKKSGLKNQILCIRDISKSFGGIKALSSCSMEIKTSKITAIIGPNGSGKTTLFNIISGILIPDHGEIIFQDENIINVQDYKRSNLGISRTFQDVKLFKNLSVKDHIKISLTKDYESIVKSAIKKEKDNNKEIENILKNFDLNEKINDYVSDLSYGQRKLLDLAVAVSKNHLVLMLDEPVAGVNPKLRLRISEILKNLRKKGETIILIEHDMNFVMSIADYIYVLDNGEVIAHGVPKKIKNNKKVLEAYLGE